MKNRDLFAAFALAGLVASISDEAHDDIEAGGKQCEKEHQLAAAKWCYGYADAMVRAGRRK